MEKVLVVATSSRTRGGITSVVKAHRKGNQWKRFHIRWIETHIDRNIIWKLYYFIRSFLVYSFVLPFYDVVHFHFSDSPSAIRKYIFLMEAKLWRKKIITHWHSFSVDASVDGRWRWIYRYMFTHSDKVLVLSSYWKEVLAERFALGDKLVVLYNPCIQVTGTKIYEKKKYILYAGTLDSRKGYRDLIEAFTRVSSSFPEWKLVFAGNGEIENARVLAKSRNVEEKVLFLGWVNGEEKERAFKEASLFCLPSYAEGFPMAVLDAWAYGLPVVTTPVGGITDVAKEGENVLLFSPGDIETLANQLKKAMADEALRGKLVERSNKLVDGIFNVNVINEKLERLYEDVAREK